MGDEDWKAGMARRMAEKLREVLPDVKEVHSYDTVGPTTLYGTLADGRNFNFRYADSHASLDIDGSEIRGFKYGDSYFGYISEDNAVALIVRLYQWVTTERCPTCGK